MELNSQDSLDTTPVIRMESHLPDISKTLQSNKWQQGFSRSDLDQIQTLRSYLYTDFKTKSARTQRHWSDSIYNHKTKVIQVPATLGPKKKSVQPPIRLHSLGLQIEKIINFKRPQRNSIRSFLSPSVASNILFSFVSPSQQLPVAIKAPHTEQFSPKKHKDYAEKVRLLNLKKIERSKHEEEHLKFERLSSPDDRSNENIDPLLVKKLPKFFKLMNFTVNIKKVNQKKTNEQVLKPDQRKGVSFRFINLS